jgi:hypothetical protein
MSIILGMDPGLGITGNDVVIRIVAGEAVLP